MSNSHKKQTAFWTTARRWHALYAGVVLCMFGAISLGRFGVGRPIGAGAGYYTMLFAWAENGTPYATDRVGQKFLDYVKLRPDWTGQQSNPGGWPIHSDGTADQGHFWLYSMLAALFYWPLKFLGADVGLSFNCLHIALLYIAVVLLHRRLGPAVALGLVLLVVGSPVLWYADKANIEFFSVVLGALGAGYLVAGEYNGSALCFALVATQNPAFGLVSLLALAFGAWRRGWKETIAQWKWLLAVAAVLVLHPAYYCFRGHAVSPMPAGPELLFHSNFLPLRHMASFWIDPDIGLLTTWPLGVPLLAAGLVMLIRQRRAPCTHGRRRIEYAAFAVLAALMLTWSYTRLSIGFGGEGTVDVSRYAVWLIFLFFPIVWKLLELLGQGLDRNLGGSSADDASTKNSAAKGGRRKKSKKGETVGQLLPARPRARPLARLAAPAGMALVASSIWLYQPGLSELARRPTPGSDWLYRHASWCFDPLPPIFYASRGGRVEKSAENVSSWSDWALSDLSGNKVFIWREAFERQSADSPAPVAGRGCLDPKAVYEIARERFARDPGATFCYINGRGQELFAPPQLPLKSEIRLTRQGHAERFLASGWYEPEENGVWTRGQRAELIFKPQLAEGTRLYAIQLKIVDVAQQGMAPRVLVPTLNGVDLGPVELSGPARLRWIVPAEKLQPVTTLVLAIRDPASPRRASYGGDPRQLGVKIASLGLDALSAPTSAAAAKDRQPPGQSAARGEPAPQQEKRSAERPAADSGKQAHKL